MNHTGMCTDVAPIPNGRRASLSYRSTSLVPSSLRELSEASCVLPIEALFPPPTELIEKELLEYGLIVNLFIVFFLLLFLFR